MCVCMCVCTLHVYVHVLQLVGCVCLSPALQSSVSLPHSKLHMCHIDVWHNYRQCYCLPDCNYFWWREHLLYSLVNVAGVDHVWSPLAAGGAVFLCGYFCGPSADVQSTTSIPWHCCHLWGRKEGRKEREEREERGERERNREDTKWVSRMICTKQLSGGVGQDHVWMSLLIQQVKTCTFCHWKVVVHSLVDYLQFE